MSAEAAAWSRYVAAVEAAPLGRISLATARSMEAAYTAWVRLSDPEHAAEQIEFVHKALARRLAGH